MLLYLMRHGIAFDVGQDGSTCDEDRSLTAEGRDKTLRIAQRLKDMHVHPDCIITSPLVRARETACIVAGVLAPKNGLFELDFLEPGGEVGEFSDWLASCNEASVLAVGHLPDMPQYAAHFLTGTRGLSMIFKKAAICSIYFDSWPGPSRGRLEWLMQPTQML